jgi:CRISPR-associated protein Cas2
VKYVVAYDIEPDRVRARVAKVLECYGTRVQESVFECDLSDTDVKALLIRLKKELKDPQDGGILFYRLCKSCFEESFGMGRLIRPKILPESLVI